MGANAALAYFSLEPAVAMQCVAVLNLIYFDQTDAQNVVQ